MPYRPGQFTSADVVSAAAFQEARGAAPLVGAAQDSASVELANARTMIGTLEAKEALDTLKKYKRGKANLEARVIEDELWWELRHWEAVKGTGRVAPTRSGADDPERRCPPAAAAVQPRSVSAWLFQAIAGKHADAMDNVPAPVALPREQSDEESARVISSVLPVIMEQCGFEETYSREWWEKLKHGTAIYSVLWDPDRENGLGDIAISGVDLLKIFWEPEIENLQDSHNIFVCELHDNADLEAEYPQLRGKLPGNDVDIAKYLYNDTVDTTEKSVVVDWYYKRKTPLGKTVLHYAKLCGETVLFASENDSAYAASGWYDHGMYPFFADVLFPEVGMPAGFGFVAICKDPQIYIDKLYSNVMQTSTMGTKRRYFKSESADFSEAELQDENKPIVHVSGPVTDDRLREIVTRPLDGIYLDVIQLKIDELNKTANNRDVSNGDAGGGVTAASAIAALQEAGNKTSRDMISGSYRVYQDMAEMCVELMRQFYDVPRTFRITNELPYEYATMQPGMLSPVVTGVDQDGMETFRKPVLDIKIKAQKKNPFSRAEQNERAKELYGLGFFDPMRAQEALIALDMMDFEGIDKIKGEVAEGQTLYSMVQQLSAELAQTRAVLSDVTGIPAAESGGAPVSGGRQAQGGGGRTIQSSEAQAQRPMTPMMQRMAANSAPNMAASSSAAAPGGGR